MTKAFSQWEDETGCEYRSAERYENAIKLVGHYNIKVMSKGKLFCNMIF